MLKELRENIAQVVFLMMIVIQLLWLAALPVDLSAQQSSWTSPLDLGQYGWASEYVDPIIMCDQHENVHVLFSGGSGTESGSGIFYWNDFNDNDEAAVSDVLYDPIQGMFSLAGTISQDPDRLHLIWLNTRAISTLYYATAPLTTASLAEAWSSPIALEDQVASADIDTDNDNRIHLVYARGNPATTDFTLYHALSEDGGLGWTDPVAMTSFTFDQPAHVVVEMAVDARNGLHVGVTLRSQEYGDYSEVGYIRSIDSGQSWESYRTIDNSPSTWQGVNWISPYTLGENEIYLTWHHPERLASVSTDGGLTWSGPVEIMPLGAAFGGANELVMDSSGRLHAIVAWYDGVFVVDGLNNQWHVPELVDGRSHDPHGQRMVVCQGNVLHTVYWDRVGEKSVWYAKRVVDAPEIAREELAELQNVSSSAPVTTMVAGQAVDSPLVKEERKASVALDDSLRIAGLRMPSIQSTLAIAVLASGIFILAIVLVATVRRH